MKIAVYPGTFDPFTVGHEDIVRRAAEVFDKIYVAILNNTSKKPYFGLSERRRMISQCTEKLGDRVEVVIFEGLLTEYAKKIGAGFIIRGLRNTQDYAYEQQMEAMNKHLCPEIETVYIMANTKYAHVTSTLVREIGLLGGDISGLVPAPIKNKIAERLIER